MIDKTKGGENARKNVNVPNSDMSFHDASMETNT